MKLRKNLKNAIKNKTNKNKNANIIIQCWTGKILFQGHHKSKDVDKVLQANRCECHALPTLKDDSQCDDCDSSGYKGDFQVYWEDPKNAPYDNVYECINY